MKDKKRTTDPQSTRKGNQKRVGDRDVNAAMEANKEKKVEGPNRPST